MKISFAITVKDEIEEIKLLLNEIIPKLHGNDEIIIIQDEIQDNIMLNVQVYIKNTMLHTNNIFYYIFPLNNNFSVFKNYMISKCSGDWIFNFDADELPHEFLLSNFRAIIESHTHIECFFIPRINIVKDITDNDIKYWGWRINEQGWINFPDYQQRMWANKSYIKWAGIVHERLTSYKTHTYLPAEQEYCFFHIKSIKRQHMQNEYYNTIQLTK